MTDPRRQLPSVNALLERDDIRALLGSAPRALVVEAIRESIDAARRTARAPAEDGWAALVSERLRAAQRPSLRRVINATGVVLHTNLGRAPLAAVAIDAVRRAAEGYTNLEYDVERGQRGSRYSHCVSLLRELTGAEDALVVNNNAAALVLALNALAAGREAVISRGELVEIGGSFRIPEIMAQSGARLREIGSTNRTHLADYEGALGPDCGVVLKVHRSNFEMQGFVAEVDAQALAKLSRERDVPLVHDLGSGLLIPLDSIGLTGEPTAADAVRAGAALVTMSGDKLLGGPQAGLIVGRADVVRRLRESPLARALRVDKLTIAALEATLMLYRDPARAVREVPVLAMLGWPLDQLRARANAIARHVGGGARVVDSDASVGGGAFPNARIPSVAVAFDTNAARLEARLRLGEPAVVGRIAHDQLLLDVRTVLPAEDDQLGATVCAALAE
jgi:L-seryl-tRNA(Ser) seleniumtransferase